MLTVYEQLFLLALDEDKGNFLSIAKKTVPYGLAGAILAELVFSGIVCSNEKQRLELSKTAPSNLDDEILAETIQEIQSSEKPRKFSFWVSSLSERPKKLRVRIGERMAGKNLVAQDENRFYWPGAQQAEATVPPKFELKNPLRATILADSEYEPRNLALLSIISACGLLNLIFTEDELPFAKRLIHEKVMHTALKNPALQTIQEIEYAIESSMEDEDD